MAAIGAMECPRCHLPIRLEVEGPKVLPDGSFGVTVTTKHECPPPSGPGEPIPLPMAA